MNKNPKKVLSIYRDYFTYDRGTPIRIRSLLREVSKDAEIELHTASRDEKSLFNNHHLQLGVKNLKNILELRKYIKNNKIDIVIFHTISAGYYLIPLLFLNRRYKKVLEMHGFMEEEGRLYNDISFFRYHRNKFLYSVIYGLCDLITTCSETASKKMLQYNKNTHTIYGGVDLKKFNSSFVQKEQETEKVGQIIIGYSGNGRIWQGLEFLLEAFSILSKRDPSFSLHLLLSEKVNIPEMPNVHVFEPVAHDNVAHFNARCDILVIPRLDNVVNALSFPSKLMEYLAMGIPVVGSKTSDIHKIITHRVNGMLYNPGDVEDFINCLIELKNPVLRRKLASNGHLLVKNKYDWTELGRSFVSLIKNIK